MPKTWSRRWRRSERRKLTERSRRRYRKAVTWKVTDQVLGGNQCLWYRSRNVVRQEIIQWHRTNRCFQSIKEGSIEAHAIKANNDTLRTQGDRELAQFLVGIVCLSTKLMISNSVTLRNQVSKRNNGKVLKAPQTPIQIEVPVVSKVNRNTKSDGQHLKQCRSTHLKLMVSQARPSDPVSKPMKANSCQTTNSE